jgi:fusaric acid resistance family protein
VAVPYGLWLLIPCAIFAALLPYGRSVNYGLLATFVTPLVVLLIDLLHPAGWSLALDRLIDTLLGCAIALVIGFAPGRGPGGRTCRTSSPGPSRTSPGIPNGRWPTGHPSGHGCAGRPTVS